MDVRKVDVKGLSQSCKQVASSDAHACQRQDRLTLMRKSAPLLGLGWGSLDACYLLATGLGNTVAS